MKLTLLGTSAWNPIPAPWCSCRVCETARNSGGKNVRKHASCLINDDTLVDFGPDIFTQCCEHNVDLRRVDRILQTHSHNDHLAPALLLSRVRPKVEKPLRLFSNREVQQRILEVCNAEKRALGFSFPVNFEELGILPVTAQPGEELSDGPMRILPIRAQHVDDETALNWLVTGPDGKKLLILNDTGWWADDSWELVRGRCADAAVIEVTTGFQQGRCAHLGCGAALEFLEKLQKIDALKSGATLATTHVNHLSGATQEEFEAFFSARGISAGYDGMELVV